jgi:hypothetical protein
MQMKEYRSRARADRRRAAGEAQARRVALVGEVKRYAEAHYSDGGWDVIVECWSDADIAEAIGRARTLAGAIRKLRTFVSVMADRQADARNSAF